MEPLLLISSILTTCRFCVYLECAELTLLYSSFFHPLPPPLFFFFNKQIYFLCSSEAHGRRTWPGCIWATDTYELSVKPHLDKTTHTYTDSLVAHCVQPCLLLMWKLFILGSLIIWLAIYCMPLCLCLVPSLTHITCRHSHMASWLNHKAGMVTERRLIGCWAHSAQRRSDAEVCPHPSSTSLSVVVSFFFLLF